MYKGVINRQRVKKKQTINLKSLFLWYVGIVISFFPIIIDMFVYLANHSCFDLEYWVRICLKGDVLWVIATIIVLTSIDYQSDEDERKKGTLQSVCAIVSLILWGVAFAVWIVFKYIYPANYDYSFPIYVTVFLTAVTLIFCSPLQVKLKR